VQFVDGDRTNFNHKRGETLMRTIFRVMTGLMIGALLTAGSVTAEEPPAIKISGFVDAYYSYNFNNPDSGLNGAGTNFDFYHNAASLNLAEVVVSGSAESVGFRMDLDFGPTADFVHGTTSLLEHPASHPPTITATETEFFKNLQQAYVSWATPVGLNLDFGKFVTHMGAEVIESKDNWNYTRGLLFCCAIPYYHAGVRGNLPLGDMLFVNGYVYNGWNNVIENNDSKTFGAQVGITPIPQLPIILAWVGPEDSDGVFENRQVYEAIVTYNVTDTVSFMVDYNLGNQEDPAGGDDMSYSGFAAYARWKMEPCALALRYEMVDDEDGVLFGIAGNTVSELTVTAEHTVGKNLLTRLEYRMDSSDEPLYEDEDGVFGEDSQSRLVLGLVYMF
jgi:hypothetical protein